MKNTDKIKAHKELLKVAEKHEDEFNRSGVASVCSIKWEIERLEKEEEFSIPLTRTGDGHFSVVGAYGSWSLVLYFSDDNGRSIGWSDDDRQPENEWLYIVTFQTGAYIFGGEYPQETFQSFFTELKQFEPKYYDTANKSLYFAPDKAKAVYESFWEIYNRHKSKVEGEMKKKRKVELLEELERLEEVE